MTFFKRKFSITFAVNQIFNLILTKKNKILAYLYFKLIYNCINPFNNSFRFSFHQENCRNKVVYMADGSIIHGGLTDRYKGIITSYCMAKRHGTKFSIFYINPLNYSALWSSESINLSKLFINPFRFKIWLVYSFDQLEIFNHIDSNKFKKSTNLFYVNENILAYLYENGEWEKQTKNTYNELDSLGTNHLKQSFEKEYSDYLSKDFSVLHFRCLHYFNDFEDSKTPPLSEEKIGLALNVLTNQLEKKYNTLEDKVFLSDSRRLLKHFQDKGYNVFSIEDTKHLDNPGYDEIEYIKAYQENHVITLSKSVDSYIFFYNRNKPFNSHFAYYAAILGDVPFRDFGFNLNNFEISELRAKK
jgi:hypothetical protein